MSYLFNGFNWDLSDRTSLANLLINQITLTALSMVIALAIAFPIALLIVRYTRLYLPITTTASVLYTVPSLAFFALLASVHGISLTIWNLVIPLVAYAQIVLIRNIVAGIRAVDPALIEVGRAVGMNDFQVQRRVVLPLALPVIIAGIRVATVTTIGIATLGFLVGQDTLGYVIQQGINYGGLGGYYDPILAGVILVTLLAVATDLLLLGIQRLLSRGRPLAATA